MKHPDTSEGAAFTFSGSPSVILSWDDDKDHYRIDAIQHQGPAQVIAWRGDYGRAFDHAAAASTYFNLPLVDLTGGQA